MNLLEEKVYVLQRNIENIPEEILNGYVIYTTYFEQYAWGITGCNHSSAVFVQEDGKPFPYATAAYKAAKEAGIKPYSRRGRDTGYGEVGAKQYTRKAITVREFLKMKTYVPSYMPNEFRPLKAA